MAALWIVLLALIIFLMYMWQSGAISGLMAGAGKPAAPGCSACAKKNVPPVE
jgi:hypothetical protein